MDNTRRCLVVLVASCILAHGLVAISAVPRLPYDYDLSDKLHSLTGKTDVVAQALAKELGADLRRVEDLEEASVTCRNADRGD